MASGDDCAETDLTPTSVERKRTSTAAEREQQLTRMDVISGDTRLVS